jgi:Zn-dependent protease with chaperone function
MITAHYFDGQSARLQAVTLILKDAVLSVVGFGLDKRYRLADTRMAEPFANAPGVLYFNDGSRCEVPAGTGHSVLAELMGYRKSWVERWQDRWLGALLALVLLLAVVAAIIFWGLPAAAVKIADALPPSADKALGEQALRALEARMLTPSTLDAARQAEVQQVLRDLAPAHPRQALRLLVRNSPTLGANALALPDGTLVITDAMLNNIYGKDSQLDAWRKAALAGVLAHEIGHVELRHSVRVLTRGSLTAAASASLFGDFSAVASGLPVLLLNMRYSREMETEADVYAIGLLKQKGLPTAPLADLFDGLEKQMANDPRRNMPSWLKVGVDFASSHPASAERSKRLRDPAAQ